MTFIPTIKIVDGVTYYKLIYDNLRWEYWISETYSIIYDKPLKNGVKSCEIRSSYNIGSGYFSFNIALTDRVTQMRYHRVLFEAIKGPVGDLQIDHINSNALDNTLDNLQAIPQAINLRKSLRTKMNTTTVLAIYQAYKASINITLKEVAYQFNVKESTVVNIVYGLAWSDITGVIRTKQKYSKECGKRAAAKRREKCLVIKSANNL